MEDKLKYIVGLFFFVVVVGLFVAIEIPSNRQQDKRNIELERIICDNNNDLPRPIGTIGSLDSIRLQSGDTIRFYCSVNGDNSVKSIYDNHYSEYKDLLMYSIVAMNGQHHNGDILSQYLSKNEIDLGFTIYTPDLDKREWTIRHQELADFIAACKLSPTEALRTTIDMQIAFVNINLPMSASAVRDAASVSLNSIMGELDENCLLQALSHVGDSIIVEYLVNESEYCIDCINEAVAETSRIENFAAEVSMDVDAREFMGLLCISHSNLVIKYRGADSGKLAVVPIPYSVLKNYCMLPFVLE